MKCKHRLQIYVETMKLCGHRFNFASVVSDIISRILQVIDFRTSVYPQMDDGICDTSFCESVATCPRSWVDIVTRLPQVYLRISFSLDYSLSRGKYPCDDELPAWIIDRPLQKSSTRSANVMDMANPVAARSNEESSIRNMSLLRNEQPGASQFYQESIPLPSNTFSPSCCIGNAELEDDTFGLGNFIGMDFTHGGFNEDSDLNEENDTSQTLIPHAQQYSLIQN